MTDDQQWRVQLYALLATLLAAPPEDDLLDNIARVDITQPESNIGQAWQALKAAAGKAGEDGLRTEYHALFIGLTQGELVPYGSYYQTGFLNEKPLARLRSDLAQLGLQRQQDKTEPEDHIAAEFDVMRLILQAEGTPIVDAATFFNRHIQPWAKSFFNDLAKARHADFYRSVAGLGSVFTAEESQRLK